MSPVFQCGLRIQWEGLNVTQNSVLYLVMDSLPPDHALEDLDARSPQQGLCLHHPCPDCTVVEK